MVDMAFRLRERSAVLAWAGRRMIGADWGLNGGWDGPILNVDMKFNSFSLGTSD